MFRHLLVGFIFTILTLLAKAEVHIISKADWNGAESASDLDHQELPVGRVVICHTVGSDCTDATSCALQVRNIQNYHMNSLHLDDIGYNFLVGGDGNVYEGRGWDRLGAVVRGYNMGSLIVTFVGTFERSLPTEAALDATRALLEEGVRLGKITEDYKLVGHRQLAATNSPGEALYGAVKQWPHWSRRA